MTETVTKALYLMGYGVEGQDKVDSLRTSVDNLTTSTEKNVTVTETAERATRTRADAADRLLAKVDDQARAEQRLSTIQSQVARLAEEGIGTEEKRNQILDAATKKYGDQSKAVGDAGAATSIFSRVLNFLVPAHKSAADAAEGHTGSLKVLREAAHVAAPVIEGVAGSVGNLGAFASASRAGIAGLAVAITGSLVVALIEAADKARVFKAQFDAIAGNQSGGAFAGAKASADAAGVSLATVAGAYKTLLIEQDKLNAQRGIVFAPGAETATKQINDVTTAIAAAGKAGLLTEQQIKQAIDTIAGSFAQSGRLTATAFKQLPEQIQRAIADAFGGAGQNLGSFQTRIDALDVSFAKFASTMSGRLQQLKSDADNTIPTLSQAWDSFKTAVEGATEKIAHDAGVEERMRGMTESIKGATAGTKSWWQALQEVDQEFANMVGFRGIVAELGSIFDSLWSSAVRAAAAISAAIKSQPLPAAPQFPGAASGGGYGPYQDIGIGGGSDIAANYNQFSGDLNSALDASPQFATGTGGIKTVPTGFPGDSYHVRLTSGEQFAVAPPGYSLVNMLAAKSSIDIGGFADGTMAPPPDAATTDQGHQLLDLGVSYQDLLGRLGVTLDDWRQTISGAGNDKIQDVVRQSAIQIIASESMSSAKIIAAITSSSNGIISAVGAQTAAQSASSAASSSGSFASSGGSTFSAFSSATTSPAAAALGMSDSQYAQWIAIHGTSSTNATGGSSSGLQGGDLDKKLNALFGNVPYNSQQMIPTVPATSSAPRPVAPGSPVNPSSPAIPQNAFAVTAPIGSDPYGPGGIYDLTGAGFAPGTDYGADFYGATGGDFIVPANFPNDSYKIAASSGERVTISPPTQISSGNTGSGVVNYITVSPTVVMSSTSTAGKSPQQIADELAKQVTDAIAAKSSANRSIGPYSLASA